MRNNMYVEYLRKAKKYKNIVVFKYSKTLSKFKNEKSKKFSFGVYPLDAFKYKDPPLPLKYVCHPANILKTSKQYTESLLSYSELKSRIIEYNSKYGNPDLSFIEESYISQYSGNRIVFGIDPGPKNFGLYIGKHTYDKDGSLSSVQPLFSGMLSCPIVSIKENVNASLQRMLGEVFQYHIKYSPDMLIIERFQARGFKGNIIELVNIMVGAVISQAYDIRVGGVEIHTPTPAIWKNQFNRLLDLSYAYKQVKDIGPHRLDAALLSMYPGSLNTKNNPYSILSGSNNLDTFISNLKKTENC